MPNPQQLIAESREKFREQFLGNGGWDQVATEDGDYYTEKEILDWHTSTLTSLLDALIEEEKEVLSNLKSDFDKDDVGYRGYTIAKSNTISRLETLKANIAKTAE